MNDQRRLIAATLGLVILLGAAEPSRAQYPDYYNRVLLVHISGGAVLPVSEDADDQHDLGFDLGLGLGFVLSSGGPISPELDFRFDFYRLPRSVPTDRFVLNEANNEHSFSVEGRFRYVTRSRIRPFALTGIGLYDTGDENSKAKFMASFGGGVDWSFDRKESILVYSELRYVAGPRGMIRLDFGVRIG